MGCGVVDMAHRMRSVGAAWAGCWRMVVGEQKVRVLGMHKEKVWGVEKWIGR